MYCVWPPYIFRPTTRFAYCTVILRTPCVIAITAAMTMMRTNTSSTSTIGFTWLAPLESAPHQRGGARQLRDLLATAVFARLRAESRKHCRQQRHHRGGADVRHNPERKDGAVLHRPAAEPSEPRGQPASGALDK